MNDFVLKFNRNNRSTEHTAVSDRPFCAIFSFTSMRNEIADEIMYGAIGLVEKTATKLLHFTLRIYLRDSSPFATSTQCHG